MKLKDIGFPSGRFNFDSAMVTEQSVEIVASNEHHEIRVFVDEVFHFRRTDESFSIETFMNLTFEEEDERLFLGEQKSFFEILDDSFAAWVEQERYYPLDKEGAKQYAFIFVESFVEIIADADIPPRYVLNDKIKI